MIDVKLMPYTAVRESGALLAEYIEECKHPLFGTPNPDWAMYEAMGVSGAFQVLGVFVDGELAGFSGLYTSVNPHYSRMIAATESLFVSKRYEDTMASARLIEAVEDRARLLGCDEIVYSAPAGGRLEKVLAKRYPRTNTVFCKSLRTLD